MSAVIPRRDIFWRSVGLALGIVLVISYFYYQKGEYPHGGSPTGLVYGIIGTVLILILLYFGVRKRSYKSTWGTMHGWLQSHIYLGLLSLFVLLAHTGGRFNDRVAVSAFVVLSAVVLSGVFGAILYLTVPRMLTDVESNLTAQELSDKLNQLNKSMARLASAKSEQFQRIHSRLSHEAVPGYFAGWLLLVTRVKSRKAPLPELSNLLRQVPSAEQDDLRQLMVFARQHKELHLRLMMQQRYRNVLDFWLYIHLPLSIALVVLVVAHIAGVFYYGQIDYEFWK